MYLLKYAVIKFIRSPSTWLIIFLGALVAGVVAGWLPSRMGTKDLIDKGGIESYTSLKSIVLRSLITVGGSLGMFSSIFAGFKGAQVFRNEVEDGTFLIMLSKPNSRRKVIFIKWISFIIFMIFFQLIIIASHNIGIIVGDKTNTIAKDFLRHTFLTELLLGILLGFIFSSVALLVSTFTTSGGTIGVSMVLGLAIPITAILALFTYQPGFLPATRQSRSDMFGNNMSISRDSYLNDQELPSIDDINHYDDFTTNEQLYFDTGHGTYTYKKLAWLDFNYQIAQLMTLATDKIVSQKEQDAIAGASLGRIGTISYLQKPIGTIDNDFYETRIIEKNKYLEIGIEDIRNQFDDFLTNDVMLSIKNGFDFIWVVSLNNPDFTKKQLPKWDSTNFKWIDDDTSLTRYDEENFETVLKSSFQNPLHNNDVYWHNGINDVLLKHEHICQRKTFAGTEEGNREFEKFNKANPKLSIFEFYCNIFNPTITRVGLSGGIMKLIKNILSQGLNSQDAKWASVGNTFFNTLKEWEDKGQTQMIKFVKNQIGLNPDSNNRDISDSDKILYMTALPVLFLSNYLTKETFGLINILTPYSNNFHKLNGDAFAEIIIKAVNNSILDDDKTSQLSSEKIIELIKAGDAGIEGKRLPLWWTELVDNNSGATHIASNIKDEGMEDDLIQMSSITNNNFYTYKDIVKSLVQSKSVYKIEYVPFLKPLNILWFYIALSILLVPISYYIVSRQNFR